MPGFETIDELDNSVKRISTHADSKSTSCDPEVNFSRRNKRHIKVRQSICIRLDRLQFVSWAAQGRKPPKLDGFKVVRDCFVSCQTTTSTYARCRQYQSTTNDTKIYWQYDRLKGWLTPWKVTIVADDETGLSYKEVEKVLKHCRHYRFLIVELAVDFCPLTGVNMRFIRQHAVFGKSVQNEEKKQALYYGSRKADKLARCYQKDELEVFRVEAELHASLLGRNAISKLDDFLYLPEVIYPKHLQFLDLDWGGLEQYVAKKFSTGGSRIFAGARKRATSMATLRRYLRREGVLNVHRFLVPLAINEDVVHALNRWARHFNG